MTKNLVFLNGNIHTMNPQSPTATAMAFVGNRIFAIGTNDQIASLSVPNKKIIDLQGKTVVPGLIDGHVHFLAYCKRFFTIEVSGIKSFNTVLSKIQEKVDAAPPGEWIVGGGWNKNLWETDQFPTKHDLDKIAPENPVLLHARDGHSIWVNSLALKITGVDKNVTDPPDGKFMRDESGELTGIIFEEARHAVMDSVPSWKDEQLIEAAKIGIKKLWKSGLTGVHDMSSEKNYSPINILQKMNFRHDGLKFRFNLSVQRDSLEDFIGAGIRSGFGDNFLRIGGLKLLADGALGSQTAYMATPFEGSSNNYGILNISPEEMELWIEKAWENGICSSVHSIGDKCNQIVIDIFEKFSKKFPPISSSYFRNRIEHVQCLHSQDVQRLAKLNLIASMQPIHIPADIPTATKYWGDRCENAYVFRSLLNQGATLAFGSDTPIETCDPIKGIHAAITRQSHDKKSKESWYPHQKITVDEAVYAYTMGCALATGEEKEKGSLAVGKLADAVVLSKDIFTIPHDGILETNVEMTIVDGEIVYS